MRFMIMVKASAATEAGILPTEAQIAEMTHFNEELARSGVLLAGEGLQPTSKGARIRYEGGGKTTVVDGPFAESKELIAGFWLIQAKSKEEAIEWLRRAPFTPDDGGPAEVEIRQIFEAEDFGDAFTPELRQREENLRADTSTTP